MLVSVVDKNLCSDHTYGQASIYGRGRVKAKFYFGGYGVSYSKKAKIQKWYVCWEAEAFIFGQVLLTI